MPRNYFFEKNDSFFYQVAEEKGNFYTTYYDERNESFEMVAYMLPS